MIVSLFPGSCVTDLCRCKHSNFRDFGEGWILSKDIHFVLVDISSIFDVEQSCWQFMEN